MKNLKYNKLHFKINLTKSQKEAYDAIHTKGWKYYTFVWSRQSGKSTLMKVLCIEWLFTHNKKIAYICRNYILAKKLYKDRPDLLNTYYDSITSALISMSDKTIGKLTSNEIELLKLRNKEVIVIDAPLLIEGGYLEMVDKLLVITCNNEIQISRIQKRDNCTREEAIVRINSQISQEEKVKYADYIIDNSGSIESLGQKVNEFLMYMKENWCG